MAEPSRCGAFGGCEREATTPYVVDISGPVYDSKGNQVSGRYLKATIQGTACAEHAQRLMEEPALLRAVGCVAEKKK